MALTRPSLARNLAAVHGCNVRHMYPSLTRHHPLGLKPKQTNLESSMYVQLERVRVHYILLARSNLPQNTC
jgi:hypothetical protein